MAFDIPSVQNFYWGQLASKNMGKVFFVDGAGGSSTHSGLTPTEPLDKIESALDLCTNSGHDYIFVTDYWDNDAMPITVDKTCVHIIGMGNARFSPINMSWCAMAGGSEACFELTASSHYCEISGFQMTTGTSDPCILVSAGVQGVWIHGNALGSQIVSQHGISVSGGDLANSLVEDNIFGCYQSPLSEDGIVGGSLTGTIIRNNLFIRPAGIGINIGGQPLAILDNRFSMAAETEGKAITLTTTGCYIDGNHAQYGSANVVSVNPYKDSSAADANTWGLNWKGAEVTYPA